MPELRDAEVAAKRPANDLARGQMFGLGACIDGALELRIESNRHYPSGRRSQEWPPSPSRLQLVDVVLGAFDLLGDGIEIGVGQLPPVAVVYVFGFVMGRPRRSGAGRRRCGEGAWRESRSALDRETQPDDFGGTGTRLVTTDSSSGPVDQRGCSRQSAAPPTSFPVFCVSDNDQTRSDP